MDDSPEKDSMNEDDQIEALIEGDLSPLEFDAVQKKIAFDADFRTRYLKAVKTDFLLDQMLVEQESIPVHIVQTRWRFKAATAIAAILMVTIFVWSLFRDKIPEGGALDVASEESLPKVEFAATSVYVSEAPQARGDDRIREGDLVAMREGYVSITLKSGVDAVIESPSNFSITGDNRMKLDRGEAWFRVPEAAIGFSVELPWMEIVDLGTEFSVEANEEVNRVQVNQGEVEVHGNTNTIGSLRLRAGESLEQNRLGEYTTSSGGLFLSPMSETETETVFFESLEKVPNTTFSHRQPLEGKWEVEEGNPRVNNGRYRGKSESGRTAVFGHFNQPVKKGENAIVIVSFRSVSPKEFFHSGGFAGLSLFDGDAECFFFGDKGKDSYSWSLVDYGPNYRQGRQDKTPYELKIQGSAETFTIRYRQRNGELDIYRGWGLQGVPVLKTSITPDLPIDRLRVASGDGGDFSFDRLKVSVARETGAQ